MPNYTPDDLAGAIAAVRGGQPVLAAAREWGVPYATIYGRLKGATSKRESKVCEQRLSTKQESALTTWVLTQGSLGFAPSHRRVRMFAERVLRAAGDMRPLGRKWMEGFLRRNPAVKTLKARKINARRVKDVTIDDVKQFFAILNLPEVKKIPMSLRWNMDETGIAEGTQRDDLVLGCSGKPSIFVQSSEDRTWTSIVECISANGQSLPPLVIFKGKTVQQQWFPQDLTNFASWHFTSSKNGWTSNSIGIEWLEKVFLPGTASEAKRLRSKRLLIMDGHGSHVSNEFIWKYYINDVYLACFPAHSSHFTQPLDMSVFSPLKGSYRRHLEERNYILNSAPISKQNFLQCYSHARSDALQPHIIKAG
ncbi:hypothetical protein CGMCC3_g17862 [Colletotrichum fructicola]|uniref:Pogo transposable element with ZNF domain n=1 Tax=Colletotrichum fructicola (strain Nara gc5) TaxID=1213859 RepID=A0A7J6INZ7_COLFN|nr:uncharacterized protein CGMCC3_g17862 [Colletotrichum fructicola]KAE9565961.1 hypothetical protein CGMCC3_g17862 [Colletotrichum fructicola]KAF4478655.1 Pogo transposable element with ZNF domain [Colletotrichum fructicola Nara gc5]